MKILLDPTLTAAPAKCSVTIQFYEFVRRTLEQRDDVFFYWIVPTEVTDEEMEFYPKHKNVRYVRHVRSRDRVRDYITLSEEFAAAIAFNGELWDFDVLLTVRAGLIPLMRVIMNSPRNRKSWWTKEVWLIEDMPMMSFKTTVPTMLANGVHDRMTIEGHLAADRAYVCSYHEQDEIVREARKHFAPSIVRDLSDKLQNVVTAQFEQYRLKTPDQFPEKGKVPFGLAYIGRMEKANNIVDIHDLMLKTWITRGDKVKLVVCTVSKVVPVFDKELVDIRQPNRKEFWEIVQNEMHAFLKMPMGGGFSLSLIEPIMLGTPVITIRSPAYESLLGKNYPFFADGPSQVPGLIKALYDDYPTFYAQFAKWHAEWFRPTYERRMKEDLLYDKLAGAICEYQSRMQSMKDKTHVESLENNKMVKRLSELIDGKEIKTIFDGLRKMGELGEVEMLDDKLDPDDRLNRNITFSTPWHPYKVGLELFYGFKDASTEVGHMERVA